MGGDYSAQINQWVNDVVIAIANWSTAIAVASIQWLVAGLGKSSEPDLSVIVPVYDRVLAISLLILGTIVALSLIDSIASGEVTHALGMVPRVVAGAFAAYAGLALVQYVAGYAALLATVWTPDFAALNNLLIHSVAVSNAVVETGGSGPHVSTFGLIFTGLSVSSLAVMVHLELVSRSALILTVTSFVPLVCIISIWPRAIGAATTMAEFLLGLFLSKFVVATVVYVGFRLVVVALTATADTDTTENWMASGLAVLLIAAFSPLVVFSALRFTHTQAGSVARSFTGATVSMAPTGKFLGAAGKALRPVARTAQKHLTATISRLRSRQ
jgi:hypothetical protein